MNCGALKSTFAAITKSVRVLGLVVGCLVLSGMSSAALDPSPKAQRNLAVHPKASSTGTTNALQRSALNAHKTNVQMRLLRQKTSIPPRSPARVLPRRAVHH